MHVASPHWFEEFLLLGIAGLLLRNWRRSEPSRVLFVLALVLALVAAGLGVWHAIWPPTERDMAITIYLCVAAVLVPALALMRPLFVRLVTFVFPRARLVRTKRPRG